MAIKIDLLPGYVGLRRSFKRVLAVCAGLVTLVMAVLAVLYYRDYQRLEKLKQDVENIEVFAKRTEAAEGAATAATTEAAPIKASVDFMADASKTGPERAAVVDLVRRYVYSGAVVSTLDLSDGQNAKFTATVRSPDDYARFVLALRKGSKEELGPLFEGLPVANGVPGFPNNRPFPLPQTISYTPQPIVFPLRVDATGKLQNALTVPVEPGAAPAAAPGGPEGMGPDGMGPGGMPPDAPPPAAP
jgi:hypothetical protein